METSTEPRIYLDRNAAPKIFAAAIRKVLHRAGESGISVTCRPGTSNVHVRIADRWTHLSIEDHYGPGGALRCGGCRSRGEHREKIEKLILSEFQHHGDKSEYQSDHFDFRFIVS